MPSRKDILTLAETINRLGTITSTKLAYFLAKTRLAIEPEVKAIQETASKSSEKFREFERERMMLIDLSCERDDENNPRIAAGNYVIQPAERQIFDSRIEELRTKYADAIAAEESRRSELEKFLEEEAPIIQLYKIKVENIPDGAITAAEMAVLIRFDTVIETD